MSGMRWADSDSDDDAADHEHMLPGVQEAGPDAFTQVRELCSSLNSIIKFGGT